MSQNEKKINKDEVRAYLAYIAFLKELDYLEKNTYSEMTEGAKEGGLNRIDTLFSEMSFATRLLRVDLRVRLAIAKLRIT